MQDLASLARAFPTLASTFTIGVVITNDYNKLMMMAIVMMMMMAEVNGGDIIM